MAIVKGFSFCGRNPLTDWSTARGFRQKTNAFQKEEFSKICPFERR